MKLAFSGIHKAEAAETKAMANVIELIMIISKLGYELNSTLIEGSTVSTRDRCYTYSQFIAPRTYAWDSNRIVSDADAHSSTLRFRFSSASSFSA